jgi:acetyltransferase-like isoleucine patch superfamily enzyme
MFVGCNDRIMVHQRRHIKPFIKEGYTIKYAARIGANVTLLPGVTIGRNAVVGAGSLVTRNIPDRVIAFGSPARIKGMVRDEEVL